MVIMPYTPQADQNARKTCTKSNPVCFVITLQAVRAVTVAVRRYGRVMIINGSFRRILVREKQERLNH